MLAHSARRWKRNAIVAWLIAGCAAAGSVALAPHPAAWAFTGCAALAAAVGAAAWVATYDPTLSFTPAPLDAVPEDFTVHFPRYGLDEWRDEVMRLRAGRFILDPHVEARIGLLPSWGEEEGRSYFFLYLLHTLLFIAPLVRAALDGDRDALKAATAAIVSWHRAHPADRSAGKGGWHGAWEDEHAVAWRAVLLAYFRHALQRIDAPPDGLAERLDRMAGEHAAYLGRSGPYRPDHNHGLIMVLGLLAAAIGFRHLPEAPEWAGLALARAEQQMAENVSSDGIHLEQSGFYHFFTLEAFLEIARAAQAIGASLSDAYLRRLDRMLGAAALMAGPDGRILGMPYSLPDLDVAAEYVRDLEAIRIPAPADGAVLLRRVQAGEAKRSVAVRGEGGYAFFAAGPGDLEVIFHTRILRAPHAHQDALGIVVGVSGKPLIWFPSTLHVASEAEPWRSYFHGPRAHNTVQMDDAAQEFGPILRPGLAARLCDSYKVNRLLERAGFTDWFASFRRAARLNRKSLFERLNASDVEIRAFGEEAGIEFVTAQHRLYQDASHSRTVVRIDGRLLVVRDRLVAGNPHCWTQSFHFGPGSEVHLDGSQGWVEQNGVITCRFAQLTDGTIARLVSGQVEPQLAGWYGDHPTRPPTPIPALSYTTNAAVAEFLWLLHSGPEEFAASRLEAGTLHVRARNLKIALSFREDSVSCNMRNGLADGEVHAEAGQLAFDIMAAEPSGRPRAETQRYS